MTDTIEKQKIRSRGSLRAQSWICTIVFFPSLIAAELALIGWTVLITGMITPKYLPSVPEGRHDVLMVSLYASLGFVLAPLMIYLRNKASKLLDYYHHVIVQGKVTLLVPSEHQGYAVVSGENRAGSPLTKRLSVPLNKWPALEVGSTYPW